MLAVAGRAEGGDVVVRHKVLHHLIESAVVLQRELALGQRQRERTFPRKGGFDRLPFKALERARILIVASSQVSVDPLIWHTWGEGSVDGLTGQGRAVARRAKTNPPARAPPLLYQVCRKGVVCMPVCLTVTNAYPPDTLHPLI